VPVVVVCVDARVVSQRLSMPATAIVNAIKSTIDIIGLIAFLPTEIPVLDMIAPLLSL